jgi:hypothetical protein
MITLLFELLLIAGALFDSLPPREEGCFISCDKTPCFLIHPILLGRLQAFLALTMQAASRHYWAVILPSFVVECRSLRGPLIKACSRKERVCFRVFRLSQPEEEVAAIRQQAICTVERQKGRCWNGFPHKHLRPAVLLSARPANPISR